MKKMLLTLILAIGAFISLSSIADSHNNNNNSMMETMPSSMQSDMQQMMEMKVKWMANKMMYMGIKMYAVGKMMHMKNINSDMANKMMMNGIQLYKMGMQMNDGKSIDMKMCKGMMKR